MNTTKEYATGDKKGKSIPRIKNYTVYCKNQKTRRIRKETLQIRGLRNMKNQHNIKRY